MAGVIDRGNAWQVWWRIEIEPGNPKKRTSIRLSKSDYSKLEAEQEAWVRERSGVVTKDCTFQEFALKCLSNKSGGFDTKQKFERTVHAFTEFLISNNYNQVIRTITRTTVLEFITHLLKSNSHTGANPYITYLRQIFAAAVDKGLLKVNPMKGIHNYPAKKIPREIPTKAERDAMLRWFMENEPLFFPWVYFMATRGWRRGELHMMKVSDLDLNGQRLNIWTTKGDVPRQARLDPQDCVVLNEHLIYLKNRGLFKPTGLLFPTKNGKPKNRDMLNLKFKKACRELDITKNITCHTWRYFVVNSILDQSSNIEVVKAITGHRDAQTILDHYAQVTPENVRRGLDITMVDLGLLTKKDGKIASKSASNGGGA